MKYIVTYTAKRKNAKRHVVTEFGRTKYFNSIKDARKCYMFRNEHYVAQVMQANYKPITYYLPYAEHQDSWFWSEQPVCLTAEDIADLANGWGKTVEELMEQVHEASESEIEEWGVYNG